jgi:hypothetical protein
MSGTCGMMGGRRRRTTKKKSRKMRGGNGYGVTASGVIAPGALEYVPNNTSGGPVTPGPSSGGRRRKSKKAKKSRRKTMRGGGSIGTVGAAFAGTGSRGIADYVPYAAKLPPAGDFAIPTGTR